MTRTSLFTLAALAALAPAALAQTVITGHYDNVTTGNGTGYDASDGLYIVPADTAGTPNATFNGNEFDGLLIIGSTATIAGGQFNNNGYQGVDAVNSTVIVTGGQFLGHPANGQSTSGVRFEGGDTGTVSGGTFSNSVVGVDAENNSLVTVSGGTFTGATDYGIAAFTGSDISVTGGLFSSNVYDFHASDGNNTTFPVGVLDIYGSFLSPATGQPLTLGQTYSLTGIGFFTGMLQNNTASQAYSYANYGATITLHNTGILAAAPEPSQYAAFAIGLLGLGALVHKAKRRAA